MRRCRRMSQYSVVFQRFSCGQRPRCSVDGRAAESSVLGAWSPVVHHLASLSLSVSCYIENTSPSPHQPLHLASVLHLDTAPVTAVMDRGWIAGHPSERTRATERCWQLQYARRPVWAVSRPCTHYTVTLLTVRCHDIELIEENQRVCTDTLHVSERLLHRCCRSLTPSRTVLSEGH